MYVICAYRPWNIELFNERISKLDYDFTLISNKNDLTYERLKELAPEIIFFLDWSWIIEKAIVDEFMCIQFHSSPLPLFRGGSPIQNQIIRGIKDSKLTAFIMDEGIDTGDIVAQRYLNLRGHIKDIVARICDLTYEIIEDIIEGKFIAKKQIERSGYYKRRKPKESEITKERANVSMEYLVDFIRMLEDPYPNAFLKIGNKKILFKSAEMEDDKIVAKIEIIEDLK